MSQLSRRQLIVRARRCLIPGLAIAYLLQILTPLRLQTDTLDLLRMVVGVVDQGDPYASGAIHFWPGLPYALAFLESLGLRGSVGIVTLNLACITIGLVAGWHVINEDDTPEMAWACVVASLGSWLLIKHCTLALTDIPCMACTMLALFFCTRATTRGFSSASMELCLASVCTIAAFFVRPNSIALAPAIAMTGLAWMKHHGVFDRIMKDRKLQVLAVAGISLGILAGLGTCYGLLMHTRYGSGFIETLNRSKGVQGFVLKILSFRSADSIETFLNMPLRFLPQALRMPLTICGGVTFLTALWSSLVRLPQLRPSDAYLLAFLGILAIWPFGDPRFLVPALPLVFRGWFAVLRKSPQWMRLLYGCAFVAGTAAAIAYSSRITFSGNQFPSVYSEGFANSYRVTAGQAESPSDPPANPVAVMLIRRYGDARINTEAASHRVEPAIDR